MNNERKKEKREKFKFYMDIGTIILSLISVVCVWLTLREMKIDRDAAYAPCIVMNPIDTTIEWDEEQQEEWLQERMENGDYKQNGEEIFVGLRKPFTELKFVNIGVGAAKSVTFEWDKENKQKLYEYLVSENPEYEGSCEIDPEMGMDIFEFNGIKFIAYSDLCQLPVQYMYMLPGAEEEYKLEIPPQYTMLIHEALKNQVNYEPGFPNLLLHVSYQDIQGNLVEDICEIAINIPYSREIDNKESYRFSMVFPDGEKNYYETE